MSQLVKTKRQANFKGFKRFGAFKGLVEQKNVVFNSFVCKLGHFWPTSAKKGPIYLIYAALISFILNFKNDFDYLFFTCQYYNNTE
jgi:hypothetical protein